VNSLPKTVTRLRRDCDLNTGPSAPESSTLTTRPPSTRTVNISAYRQHPVLISVCVVAIADGYFKWRSTVRRAGAAVGPNKTCVARRFPISTSRNDHQRARGRRRRRANTTPQRPHGRAAGRHLQVYLHLYQVYLHETRWLGSRAVSVLDSGAAGPGFRSQSRRCRVTVLGRLFTPIVPLFTKQRNW